MRKLTRSYILFILGKERGGAPLEVSSSGWLKFTQQINVNYKCKEHRKCIKDINVKQMLHNDYFLLFI
jgi:hypothetical protein